MAYNNWNNGRGWNNGPRNWGGAPRQQQYYPPQQDQQPFPFEIGQKVIHVATGTELFVIGYGREQIECRKPDLTSGYFYVHELEAAASK